MKKAYVVAEMAVTEPAAYANDYSRHVLPTLAPYGGQVLVRGGERVQLEGEDASRHAGLRTVMLEFPSLQQARDWYDSAAYAQLRTIRQQYSTGRLFIVEGS